VFDGGQRIAGVALWSFHGEVEVRFAGHGADGDPRAVLVALGEPLPVAWARQIHSATVLAVESPGLAGEGDALVTHRRGLALAVATADCVPIALGGDGALAVIHAGWRGIAAGVVAAAVARLERPAPALAAWIGPAIGPCCYEVGWEVAEQVVAATTPAALRPSAAGGRPYLDLAAAVAAQLSAAGVAIAGSVPRCTSCNPELSSHRRDGLAAGRNLAFAWLVT
jgi:hypothetical protein